MLNAYQLLPYSLTEAAELLANLLAPLVSGQKVILPPPLMLLTCTYAIITRDHKCATAALAPKPSQKGPQRVLRTRAAPSIITLFPGVLVCGGSLVAFQSTSTPFTDIIFCAGHACEILQTSRRWVTHISRRI